MIVLIIIFVVIFLIPFIAGLTGKHKILKYYGINYQSIFESDKPPEETTKEQLHEINKNERLQLLDQTLVQYNKLIDNLAYQYENETNEKKKAAILKQQIAALEKYNKALERMEKLDN